jgi:RNA polymerase sigma-70 factor (sigma-E family)
VLEDVTIEAVPVESGVDAGTTAPPSFAAAYDGMYRAAYRVAYRLLGQREDAADVAQEACARAYARWRHVSRYDSADGWVARVAGNLSIDLWRRRATASKHATVVADSGREFDGERVDLHRALAALPRRQRQVVLLRFVADLPEAAVASAVGSSIGTVKSHASRGLAALRARLGNEEI